MDARIEDRSGTEKEADIEEAADEEQADIEQDAGTDRVRRCAAGPAD